MKIPAPLALTLVPLSLWGCGGHSGSTRTAATTAAPVASETAPVVSETADWVTVSQQAVPDQAQLGPDALALALDLRVTSATALEALVFQASGTLDERELGALRVVLDVDGDGLLGPEDVALGGVEGPAFLADDGVAQVPFGQALQLSPGVTTRLWVTVDASAIGPEAYARVGQTLALSLAEGGVPAPERFELEVQDDPERTPVSLYLHDHVLITEVSCDPGFVELANPTASSIDLHQLFLTSSEYAGVPGGQIATSQGCHGAGGILARFPAGATLAPGQVVTVAMQGEDYLEAFDVEATYALRMPSAGSQQMLTGEDGAWVAKQPQRAALGCDGGTVTVFAWDGAADLVLDVDMLSYGDATRIDKSEVSVDGPDAGATPSTYLPETPAAEQQPAPAPGKQASLVRVSHTELGESALAGNGVGGHDETSEPWATTFAVAPASPGVVD